jgi:hypothetical protein
VYATECTVTDSYPLKSISLELSSTQRLRYQYFATAAIAAKKCEHYSYREAEAALNAKLRGLPDR